jgi:hypothetical protein
MDPADVNDESAASGKPTRCLLFANRDESRITNQRALEEHVASAFAEQPVLAIDVGNDAISVIDPASNAVITSAGLAQVTATPGIYAPIAVWSEGTSREYKQPVLLLEVPGVQDLRIGILPMRFSVWNGEHFRYAWRGKAWARLDSKLRTTHVVTETEWFSLLEKFGLAALVVDEYASGKLDRRERFAKVYLSVFFALLFVASMVFLAWVFIHRL